MEMTNNWVDFEHYEGNSSELVAYEEITGNFIFNVKLSDNFRRKARFVADGNLVDTPASMTYSTVVSRYSSRILLLVSALKDLKKRVQMYRMPSYQLKILKIIGLALAPNLDLNKGNDLLL